MWGKELWCGLACCLFGLFIQSVQAEPRRFALVVGVREYPVSDKLTPLAFTEPDAEQLAATLQRSEFRVTLMTQTASKGPSQERFAPNAALIRKQFRDLVGEPFLTKEDCLLVILEGHGIQLPARADAEKLTFYFCPADAQIDDLKFAEEVQERHNLIPVQELYDTLKQSSAGVKLLVVDACRNDPNKVDNFRSGNSVTRPPVPSPPGGIAALFSCSANQRAAEDPALKHGVFSYFLIEALAGKADLDGDRHIDLTELHKYVGSRTYTHVRETYSTQQLPEFKGEINGWAPLLSLPAMPTLTAGTKAGELWEGNSLAMKFRWCPPGKFTMGSSKSDIDALMKSDPSLKPYNLDDEEPVEVTLTRGYWLGQYEVTQREWEQLMGTAPWKEIKQLRAGENIAVAFVNWEECSEFCRKLTALGRQEGWLPNDWRVDLPTEAQWEYACRAGTTTRFSFGNDIARLSEYAWWGGFQGEGNARTEQYPHPVGLKKPNPWSFYDMHGNVWEWCRDWFHEKLPGGVDPDVQEGVLQRAYRGGGWTGWNWVTRSAGRSALLHDVRTLDTGFRVALVPVN